MPSIKLKAPFTDRLCQSWEQFSGEDDGGGSSRPAIYRDTRLPQLYFRVNRSGDGTFHVYHDTFRNGARLVVSERLGRLDRGRYGVKEARRDAQKVMGRIAAGRIEEGKRAAVKMGAVLDAYLEHLENRRSPTWHKNASSIVENHIRPQWGGWSAAAMANDPDAVVSWHAKVTKKAGPTAANHAARILRAAYRRAARTNRRLPRYVPTSGVEFNVEKPKQSALPFRDFPKWAKQWSAIPSSTRRGFHLLCLASGGRPGEVARLKKNDVDLHTRTLTFRAVKTRAKAVEDITVPMSPLIVMALKLARDGGDKESEYVFPARGPKGYIVRFDSDGLIACGNQLRHTYRTVCQDLHVSEVTTRLLMGHSLAGINQGYITREALQGGIGLRQAQAKVSRRIMSLLKWQSSGAPAARYNAVRENQR